MDLIKEYQNDFIRELLEEPLFKLKAEKERELRQLKRDAKRTYISNQDQLNEVTLFLETINDWLTKIN